MRRTWSSSQRLSKASFVLIVAVVAALVSSTTSAVASRNGVEDPTNTFTVGITFKFGAVDQLCSGALLNPTLVVTAGHCAFSTAGETGTTYLFTSPGTPLDAAIDPRIVQPKVIKIFTDPSFSTKDANNVNDIAFLKLDSPVIAKNYLKIATREELEQLTSSSNIAGYGYGQIFETGASYSIYPRKYSLTWNPIDSSTVLANTFTLSSSNAGPCKGDSGGPIVATLPSGKQVLVGALSGANNVLGGCSNPDGKGEFSVRLTIGYPFLPLIAGIYDPAAPVLLPTPKPSSTPTSVKKTIKCRKGSVIKKVTAIKPVCPKGYKLTK
jgi:secreted trypsin-like serine protease